MDVAQVVIGLGGGIPLIGNLLDGFNAGISFARGDKLGATIDGLSAIPGAGQVAGALGIARRGKRLASVGRRLVQRFGPTVTGAVVRAKSLVANVAERTASAASGAVGRFRSFLKRRKGRPITLRAGTQVERAFEEGVTSPIGIFLTRGATARRIRTSSDAVRELALKGTSGANPNFIATIEATADIGAKIRFIEGGGRRAVEIIIDPADRALLREVGRRSLDP